MMENEQTTSENGKVRQHNQCTIVTFKETLLDKSSHINDLYEIDDYQGTNDDYSPFVPILLSEEDKAFTNHRYMM